MTSQWIDTRDNTKLCSKCGQRLPVAEFRANAKAMLRACRNAKVPHYHPHDLRHRRISIWHQSGVPARELAERAGHARPSMSLDVYSHLMPADEVSTDKFVSLLTVRRNPR
jgi:integrase